MTRIIAAAALAATFIAGSLGSASALPIDPISPINGAFSGTSPTGTSSLPVPVSTDNYPIFAANNIDYFGFYIPIFGSYTIVASVQATPTDNVQLGSFLLYNSQADLLPGDPFSAATYTTYVQGKFLALNRVTLAKGLYYLGVGATGQNEGSTSGYAGTISKALSPVPLPASAPMFGAAILALGAVGYGLKRKKAAVTTA